MTNGTINQLTGQPNVKILMSLSKHYTQGYEKQIMLPDHPSSHYVAVSLSS